MQQQQQSWQCQQVFQGKGEGKKLDGIGSLQVMEMFGNSPFVDFLKNVSGLHLMGNMKPVFAILMQAWSIVLKSSELWHMATIGLAAHQFSLENKKKQMAYYADKIKPQMREEKWREAPCCSYYDIILIHTFENLSFFHFRKVTCHWNIPVSRYLVFYFLQIRGQSELLSGLCCII